MNDRLHNWLKKIKELELKIQMYPNIIRYGHVVSFIGLVLEVQGLELPIGALCIIESVSQDIKTKIEAEVVGFKDNKILMMLLRESKGIFPGLKVFSKVNSSGEYLENKFPIGSKLLGRVLDSQGNPLDGLETLQNVTYMSLAKTMINPLLREPINQVLDTGVRAINGLLTVGRGQKMGIFAASGVGKSVLLSMMSRSPDVDVIVIGLIGERNREIREFIENLRNRDNLERSIIVVSPAEVSPILKVQATLYVAKIAEYFCAKNQHVLLILDSLTRYAMAHREIALAVGEIPVSRGYPPSIFSKLPLFIERSGNSMKKSGSISAFYTILVENNDEDNDPISEIARSILDGHITLSKFYAESGHFPAIDIETSISRTMFNLVDKKYYDRVVLFKQLVSSYQRNRDLINVGAYVSGTDQNLDKAIMLWPKLKNFLQQKMDVIKTFEESYQELNEIFDSK